MILLALWLAVDWTGPARELARKIAAGREDTLLEVRNVSSLAAEETARVRSALEAELRARGARLVTQSSAALEVRVSLAENWQQLVWAAEIRRGEERNVVIVSFQRPVEPPVPVPQTIALEKRLLREQDRPILDAVALNGALVVLEPDRLVIHRPQTVLELPLPAARTRDPRGRLAVNGDAVVAHWFGGSCRVSLTAPAACTSLSEPWSSEGGQPAPGRNHFTAPDLPAFFSSAVAEGGERVHAGVDGRVRLGINELPLRWGSDLAGVETACGRLVLATRPAEPEAIQAFRIAGGKVVPAAEPLELPGPVTALWSFGDAASAVVRHSKTGRYAAYTIQVACSR